MTTPSPSHLLTVLTPDQTGIIAGITALLDELDVGVLALSQTVVHDWFTVLISVDVPAVVETDVLRDKVQAQIGREASVTIVAHRAGAATDVVGDRYVLTATGGAARGLVPTVSAIVAARGGNFTDFYSQLIGDQVTMVAEVDLPADVALDQLQIDLRHATAHADLHVRVQHHRLFVATNEIAFRRVQTQVRT
jgi:predicted amino acid-binding ACT domain protein